MSDEEKTEEEKEKEVKSLACSFGCSLIVIVITLVFFRDAIPFDIFEFWFINISVGELLRAMSPLFIWGIVLSLFCMALKSETEWRKVPHINADTALGVWLGGTLVSIKAGVIEELVFRWFRFYTAMIFLQLSNFLFFGFLGFGIAEAIAIYICCPLADVFTLGFLTEYLYHPAGWYVGAALLASNGNFRDGHSYQGPIGWINSWFCGMVFFFVMFEHGLFAAMLAHFFYNFFLFTMVAAILLLKKD